MTPQELFYDPWPINRKRRKGWVTVDLEAARAQHEYAYALLAFYVVLRKYCDKLETEARGKPSVRS